MSHDLKVQDGTWTFEHEFLKKLLMSNVYLKDIPLAGHLYRVTIWKVTSGGWDEIENEKKNADLRIFNFSSSTRWHF